MSTKIIDLTDFTQKHTLEFRLDPDTTWVVPPFAEETELAFWRWQRETFRRREGEQKAAMGLGEAAESDERTMGTVWAPLIALAVREPELDPQELLHRYPGQLLRTVGTAIVDFFLTGETKLAQTESRPES